MLGSPVLPISQRGGAVFWIGAPAKCAPPLRTASTQEGLWQRWIAGQIDTLGSDHSPAPPDMKISPDFFEIWGGIAGCQHAFPLLIAEAEKRAKGSGLSQFVQATSLDVARRFGISDRKGKIATGYDADLVLVNLGANETVRDLLYKHPVSPYLGKPLTAVVSASKIPITLSPHSIRTARRHCQVVAIVERDIASGMPNMKMHLLQTLK